MQQRKSVKIQTNWKEPLNHLSQSEKGDILDAIMQYSFSEVVPELSNRLRIAFGFIKIDLDKQFADEKVNLYIIRLSSKHEIFIKIGITSNLKQRYQQFKGFGYQVTQLKIIQFSCRKKALEIEKNLHKIYSKFEHYPLKIFGGMHECFSNDIPFFDGLKSIGEYNE